MKRFKHLFVILITLVVSASVYMFKNDIFLSFYTFMGLMMFYFGLIILLAPFNNKDAQ
ncbi:hypothetical protein HNQ35_001330 [Cerasibacillus quisquiliarum]|uniref:Uncharacterized protein n=1 Tax=Cerasibacillus quisquiliarum TaxID=227865 RepID=A0A511UWA1_9BACI|nr:hypothetical protein [Cerasibacillus quisquiliarum]MBB5146129.1 hypothetical protein [Cerasibacillus quisquiliarum]GEN30864.1 hypothetical protein CQU01_11020 [Cerasibacillus quisquiliarum]